MPAAQSIFQRCGEGVAQVQFPGHIWRGHDDGERGLVLVDVSREVSLGQPVFVNSAFHIGRVVGAGYFG